MFNIAIDVGSKNTKGVSDLTESNGGKGRVLVKTVVAPAVESYMNGKERPKKGHIVSITPIAPVDGPKTSYFIHDLAVTRDKNAMFMMNQDKTANPILARVIYLATAALLGADRDKGPIRLGAGLPLGTYSQRYELKKLLMSFKGWVAIDNGLPRRIEFDDVVPWLQGAATIESIPDLPNGTYAVIGIGGHTTDVVVVELSDEEVNPIPGLCKPIELGTHQVQDFVKERLQEACGITLDDVAMIKIMAKGKFSWKGKVFSVPALIDEGRAFVAQSLVERIVALMGSHRYMITRTFFTGGGAVLNDAEKEREEDVAKASELASFMTGYFSDHCVLKENDALYSDAVGLWNHARDGRYHAV